MLGINMRSSAKQKLIIADIQSSRITLARNTPVKGILTNQNQSTSRFFFHNYLDFTSQHRMSTITLNAKE
jgi:hypothetical protein